MRSNRRVWMFGAVFALTLSACAPGYMSKYNLESRKQGPTECAERCEELGMKMGALVLVADSMPGCVCQPAPPRTLPASNAGPAPSVPPVPSVPPAPSTPVAPAPAGAPATSLPSAEPRAAAELGAAVTTASFAIMLAAQAVQAQRKQPGDWSQ